MRLHAVELRRVALPLVTPFRTALGAQTERHALLVRVITDAGDGWGECVAELEPSYSPEFVDGALLVLERHLLPRLFAAAASGGLTAAGVAPALAAVKGHPMAKAAVEMAVLDAELRAEGRSLADRLGAVRSEVDCGVAIGLTATVEALLEEVGAYVAEGYRRVKLKIEPGADVDRVRAVREHFPDLALQVDANGAYQVDDFAHLAELDAFGLLMIEQPLPDDDLDGHAAVAAILRTPVCLDETITSARVAAHAIATGACSVVNVKAGRVGGYLEAVRVHDVCRAAGVQVWCGGMLETGLGRAANLALAALPGFTLPGDLSASDRYFRPDVTEPFVMTDGRMRVPHGPGIGVAPVPEHLDALTIWTELVRPG